MACQKCQQSPRSLEYAGVAVTILTTVVVFPESPRKSSLSANITCSDGDDDEEDHHDSDEGDD